MKKLLYFVVSVLSLSVIFAAGWASGVGTVTSGEEKPAAVRSGEITEECPDCPDDDECPTENGHHEGINKKDSNLHKHGFRMKLPFPPIDRDDIIKFPKTVS